MRMVNGLQVLVSAMLCGLAQTATGQSSAKAEVLAALAEQDKAFIAGDETKVAQVKTEDYLQTNVRGKVQDKQTWLKEYLGPLAPLLRSGQTRVTTFDRSDIVVRDFGDTVVVVGKLTFKFAGVDPRNPGDSFPPGPASVLSFTQVWIKRGGTWKEAVLHNSFPAERREPGPAERK